MKFCVLASGSKGNALWVEEGGSAILIDCGLSCKELTTRTAAAGLDLSRLGCILVTHDHRDHISGLGPTARRLKIPVLATAGTRAGSAIHVGEVTWELFRAGDALDLSPFKVRTFSTPHDARDPVGFIIETAAGRLGLATDLGEPTALVRDRLRGLSALILEFNHDLDRLMANPAYPIHLKQRVRGRRGHLSNAVAGALAAELYHQDMRHLILAHLSENNNTPDLALQAAIEALDQALEPVAAGQWTPTRIFDL